MNHLRQRSMNHIRRPLHLHHRQRSMEVQVKIATGQVVVTITWIRIALLKKSMELLHQNMKVSQASMGTAALGVEESMERTKVTNQPPRRVTNQPLKKATNQPQKKAIILPRYVAITQPPREVTIQPLGEATIQPRYVAITQAPRNHSQVMQRTKATRRQGVTTRPR